MFKTTSPAPGNFTPMGTVALESRHISTHIDRSAEEVYDYASDPAHLLEWAPGLGTSIDWVDEQWIMDSPMGRITVTFVPRNELGVLDHHVRLESGETVYNPLRVITDGAGCEVVFSLRRREAMSDEDFERDADAVLADLRRLKRRMEQP
ncbi:SRPBCC family protein [Actinoplanes sp. CA-051413]|uniref:SRPBCC family protein n=1 Tax=Actinoplanes sp. CA-051413 TaxID=3239899 RepID=UPI003D99CCBE